MIPLVTEGGNHPPEAYASACGRTIFNIDPSITPDRRTAAESLLAAIVDLLGPYFHTIIQTELQNLECFHDYCDNPPGLTNPLAESAVREIQKLGQGTPWECKLLDCEWREAALNTIAVHLMTAAHAERLWFADRNPTNQSAVAYKNRYHGA